jgi:hypothetical protein
MTADEELIQIKKNKIQVWKDAEDRAKEYYTDAMKKRKAAERELSKLVGKK